MSDVTSAYGTVYSASALAANPYLPGGSAAANELAQALDTPEGVLPGTGGGSTGTTPTPLQAGASFLSFLTLANLERVGLVILGGAMVIVGLSMMGRSVA